MKPHFWMPIVALVALTGVAHAQPPQYGYGPAPYGAMPYGRPAYAAPRANPAAEAAGVLREGIDKLLTYLQATDDNKLQVAAYLDKEIAPYFDFDHMAKWVAGARWQRMGAERREAMAADLEARFLSTLAKQLAKYEDQQVRFLRPRTAGRGAVSVPVGILRPGSYPSKLEFRMYKGDDGWKVYDVVANGRSASAYYRTQLARASMPPQGGTYGR
jgi:phospholipid transport system substrate-binding protein